MQRHILAFFHVMMEKVPFEDGCVLSAGVLPERIGSGFGVILGALALDRVFTYEGLRVATVVPANATAQRIASRLGFQLVGEHWVLSRDDWPGVFADEVLSRMQYARA
jgi:RimJ/RimL family protein N-acetyltransferase